MSNRYKGGFITATPPTTSSSSQSAPGIWTTTQQMQISAAGNWPPYLPPDPYFDYVTLLLNGNGTNGAQNNTFVDSSSNNFTITRNGNTTQGSFSPYGSLWSNYFTTSAYLGLGSSSNWTLGSSGDFTVEGWIFANGTQDSFATVVTNTTSEASGYENKFIVLIRSGNILSWRDDTGSTSISATMALNQWNHFAFVRSGSTITGYLNGTSIGTQTSAQAYTSTGTSLLIGGGVASANSFKGYISNLRIVKGTAVYTSNFTPSTTPLTAVTNTVLLTCQSNRFIDNSSNNATITVGGTPSVQRFSPFNPTASYSTATIGGSGYFDGSGDYLTVANNSNLYLTTDFTIEMWVNVPNVSAQYPLVQYRNGGTWTSGNFQLWINSGGYVFWDVPGGPQFTTSGTVTPNTWAHIAVTRQSGTIRGYINGVYQTSVSDSTSFNTSGGTEKFFFNYDGSSSKYFPGYASDLRINTTTALYTGASNFTPPTLPETAVSGTALLCNFTNAGIPDLAMMNDLETVGNAQVSTSVKKYGTGSLAFDGTGDYLLSQSNPAFDIGGATHCIEMWVYANSWSGGEGNCFVCLGTNSTTNSGQLRQNGSNQIQYYLGSIDFATSSVPSANSWSQIVATYDKSASIARIFINGVLQATQSVSNTASGSLVASVGVELNSLKRNYFNGYLDDLRITNGVIPTLYQTTSTTIGATIFTPPTAALPTY